MVFHHWFSLIRRYETLISREGERLTGMFKSSQLLRPSPSVSRLKVVLTVVTVRMNHRHGLKE